MRLIAILIAGTALTATSGWADGGHHHEKAKPEMCKANKTGTKEQCVASVAETTAPSVFDRMPPAGTHAKCHITGESIVVDATTLNSVHAGKTYVFCCPGCKAQFDANPEKYVKK